MQWLQTEKSKWQSKEVASRERWEKEQTKKIKEITAKGLEPQLEWILQQNKEEKRNLIEQQANEIVKIRRQVREEYEEEISKLDWDYRSKLDEAIKEESKRCESVYQSQQKRLEECFEIEQQWIILRYESELQKLWLEIDKLKVLHQDEIEMLRSYKQ